MVDAGTNWYNIKSYRYLAQNAGTSLHKGDPVVVMGKLVLRQWTSEDGKSGTSPDIEAVAMGHDLSWGTARFTRPGSQRRSSVNPEGEGQDANPDLPSDESDTGLDDPSNADGPEDAADLDEELAGVNMATGEIVAAEAPY
jgi:single-strand DNA-binding protein